MKWIKHIIQGYFDSLYVKKIVKARIYMPKIIKAPERAKMKIKKKDK